jgi:hypothetical protein
LLALVLYLQTLILPPAPRTETADAVWFGRRFIERRIAPGAPVITAVTDGGIPVAGTVANGGLTNDATPTLTGTAEPNSTVMIFDGATPLGTATADGTGAWTFTTVALPEGGHSFTATATDADPDVTWVLESLATIRAIIVR